MKNFRSFKKDLKGISPIFATLILIAIAIIAGVVVYMFTSGALTQMQGTTGGAQERMAVQSVQYTGGETPSISVMIQNTGTSDGTATGIIIKNSTGNTVQAITSFSSTSPSSATLSAGELNTVTSSSMTALTAGTYTVTVTTAAGGSFVSSSFVV